MKKHITLALALAIAPSAAFAGELSYGYVEAAYTDSTLSLNTFDFYDTSDNGYALKVSSPIGERFYGSMGMHAETFDGQEVKPWELALGVRQPMAEGVDFVAEVAYLGVNSRADGTSYHNDGYRVAAGVRAAIGEHVELAAKATWTDVENADDVVGVNIGAHVKFNQTWGAVAQYHYNEYNFIYYGIDTGDVDTWQVGVRYSF